MKNYLEQLARACFSFALKTEKVVCKCVERGKVNNIIILVDEGRGCYVENPDQGLLQIRVGKELISTICDICFKMSEDSSGVCHTCNLHQSFVIGHFYIERASNIEITLPQAGTKSASYFAYALSFSIFHELGHVFCENIGESSFDNEMKSDVFAFLLTQYTAVCPQRAVIGCLINAFAIMQLQQTNDDFHPTVEQRISMIMQLSSGIHNDENVRRVYGEIRAEFERIENEDK